jgi:uncharacterized protein YwlG (UPF0340 family)
MQIKNVTGTAGKECPSCDTWLDHWKKHSRQDATVCGVLGCSNTDVVGAHVRKVDNYDFAVYIYPLCNGCNQATGVLSVWEKYPLVLADACK